MSVSSQKTEGRPNLSLLALFSFVVSFSVARTFTTFSPDVNIIAGGYHIHHFWYGLATLAIGGWLGISYSGERTDRLASILFGAGGGLIGDEVGLLLTFGDYWTGTTYVLVIAFLSFISFLVLFMRYSSVIFREFSGFARRNASLYFGVLLAAVSIAFITETNDIVISIVSGALTVLACTIVLAYFMQRIRQVH